MPTTTKEGVETRTDNLLTIQQASARTGKCTETILRAIRAGKLEGIRIPLGSRYVLLVRAEDLNDWPVRGPGRPRKERGSHAAK